MENNPPFSKTQNESKQHTKEQSQKEKGPEANKSLEEHQELAHITSRYSPDHTSESDKNTTSRLPPSHPTSQQQDNDSPFKSPIFQQLLKPNDNITIFGVELGSSQTSNTNHPIHPSLARNIHRTISPNQNQSNSNSPSVQLQRQFENQLHMGHPSDSNPRGKFTFLSFPNFGSLYLT